MSVDASAAAESMLGDIARADDLEVLWKSFIAEGRDAIAERISAASDLVHRLAVRDVAAALKAGRGLVDFADRTGVPAARAKARLALAVGRSYGNAFEDALATLDEAAVCAADANDAVVGARVQMARVHGLVRLGRLDEAAQAGERALAALRGAQQTDLAAKAEANLGVIERMRMRPAAAIDRFKGALAGWGADPVGRAQLTSNLAEALLELDRFAEAEAAFRSALAALDAAGVLQAATIVEGNLADLLARQGRLQEALVHYEHVRRRHVAGDARGDAARLQAEEADAFAQTGLLNEAVAEYQGALMELERHGLVAETTRARLGLVRSLARLGRNEEAERTLFSITGVTGALLGRVRCAEADLAASSGSSDRAAELLHSAIELLVEQPLEQALARAALASILIELGRADEASAHISAAKAIAAEFLYRPLEAEALHLEARHALASGDRVAAFAALRSAIERVETLRGTLQSDRMRSAFTARHASSADTFAIELVRNGDEQSLFEALEVAERVRSRSLLELVAGTVDFAAVAAAESDDPTAAALVREAASIRHEANALFSRLDQRPDAARSDAWRGHVIALEERLTVIETRLGATHRLSGLVARSPDQEAIRTAIARGTALVSYHVARDRMLAIALFDGRIVGADLGAARAIAECVERWRFQIHRSLVSGLAQGSRAARIEADLASAAAELSSVILAPLWPAIASAERFQFVPAGPLHAITFATLPIEGGALYVRAPVASIPSVGVLAAMRPPDEHRGTNTLVVGVADEVAPAIAAESRAIAGLRPNSTLLVDGDATRERFAACARNADVIHVASHGRFVPESPARSGIRLADGWLCASEIFSLRLPGAVVILSGCDTGRVDVDGGDEVTGILRGFFAAGAQSIVLSAWPVHDEACVSLMTSFHRNLSRVNGLVSTNREICSAEALRSAMLVVRDLHPRLVEWGAFSLHGDVGGHR